MDVAGGTTSGTGEYEAPQLTVHGTLAEATQAALIGPFIDNSQNNQGRLIIGNTSF